jgi:hypothetical protein
MADDRFERFKQMAKNEFGVSVVKADWNKAEVCDAIHELSDIRAEYNLFDDEELPKYHACSLAIKALREVVGE